MSWAQSETDYRNLKLLLGTILGLASTVGGWIIFSAEGFYSPMLFLTGFLMMPVGVLLTGLSLASLNENRGVPVSIERGSQNRSAE